MLINSRLGVFCACKIVDIILGNVHPCDNFRLIYFIIIFWNRYTKVYKIYIYYSLVRVIFVNLGVYEILLVYYTGFLQPTITRLFFM